MTHLPQIACFADRHVRVRKEGGEATVEVLDDRERVQELSRMLAGLARSGSAALPRPGAAPGGRAREGRAA